MPEEPWEIGADYLGGDPDFPSPVEKGRIVVTRSGDMSFRVLHRQGVPQMVGQGVQTEWRSLLEIRAEVMLGASLGDTNHMQALTRAAAGTLLAGSIGGLIGMLTASRGSTLLVAASRGDFPFLAAFRVEEHGARSLLSHMQGDRKRRGEVSLPSVEQAMRLLHAPARSVADLDEAIELLRELVGQARRQTGLLEELLRQREESAGE